MDELKEIKKAYNLIETLHLETTMIDKKLERQKPGAVVRAVSLSH
jgi:hypothetical protein